MARYSDEFRAQAIVMLEASGWPEQKGALMRVAKTLHIPHATLSRWARQVNNPPPTKTVRIKEFNLLQALREELEAILETMPHARPDADYKELGTVLGIIVDKTQLLEGKATERIEVMDDDERANRLAEILDAARKRRDQSDSQYVN